MLMMWSRISIGNWLNETVLGLASSRQLTTCACARGERVSAKAIACGSEAGAEAAATAHLLLELRLGCLGFLAGRPLVLARLLVVVIVVVAAAALVLRRCRAVD